MKLNTINESFKGKEAIKKTAMAVASLKNILLRYQDKESLTELYSIFKTPSPKNWPRSAPLISKALTYIQNDKQIPQSQRQTETNNLNDLKAISAPVAVASFYSMDPKETKGTPLEKISMSKSDQENLKLSLGPLGYVGTLSNAYEIPSNTLKNTLKVASKTANDTFKLAKSDMPNIKPSKDF